MKIISIPGCCGIGASISTPSQEILGRFHGVGAMFIEVEEDGARSFKQIVKTNDKDNPFFLKDATAEQVDNKKLTERNDDE